MIKGINHSVIEVSETGNEFYERAILIVKPEYAGVQRAVLEDEARRMLREMDVPGVFRTKRNRLHTFLIYALLVLSGMLAGGILKMII